MIFNDVGIDVLKEIANIGAGKAATSLSEMIDTSIKMSVPKCEILSFSNICEVLGGPEVVLCACLVQMGGDMEGFIMMISTLEDACNMVSLVTGEKISYDPQNLNIEELYPKLLPVEEVTNILVSAYLRSICDMTEFNITQTVPSICIDMAQAIMNVPALVYGDIGDEEVLMMETKFSTPGLGGNFLLIPTVESYHNLLKELNIE